jgi:hypothetical protein
VVLVDHVVQHLDHMRRLLRPIAVEEKATKIKVPPALDLLANELALGPDSFLLGRNYPRDTP